MFEQPAINIERGQALQLLPDGSWAPTETRFVQIYHSIITSGLLADIRGNDLKVLIGLGLNASPLGTPSPKARQFFRSLLEQGLVTPDDRGKLACFVPHDELAEMVGIHPNTLTACAKRLEKRGLIKVCPVSKGSVTWNLYLILPASHLDRFYTYHPYSTGTKIVPVGNGSPAQIGTDIRTTDSTTTAGTALTTFDDQAVLVHFARRKGVSHYRPTAHDRRRLAELHSAGISQDAIIAAIDRAFDQRPPDAPPIRQFSYCAAIALRDHDYPTTGQAISAEDPATGSAATHAVPAVPTAAMDTPSVLDYVRQLYQAEIGRITPAIERELEALTQQFSDPQTWERAFAEAARNEHRKLSYVAAVLRGPNPSREKEKTNGKRSVSSKRANSHRRRSSAWTPEQLAAEQLRASAVQPLNPVAVLGTANA